MGEFEAPSNMWFLTQHSKVPNSISIVSAIYAQLTADSSYTLQWAASSPKNCPFPWGISTPHRIHGSLGPHESTTQMASQLVQPFFQGSRQSIPIIYNRPPFPQIAPFHGEIWTPSNIWLFGPTQVLNPNDIAVSALASIYGQHCR